MTINPFLLLLGLFGATLAGDRQPGVVFEGMERPENEEIQATCGKALPSKKIHNGINLTSAEVSTEALWMVKIFAAGPYHSKKRECTGVLISRWHVLTAADCHGFYETTTVCDDKTFEHNTTFTATKVSKYILRVYTRFGHLYEGKEEGGIYEIERIIFPASWTKGDSSHRYCKTYNDDTEDIAIYQLKMPVAKNAFACVANVPLKYKPLTNFGYGSAGLEDITGERSFLKKHVVKYTDCKEAGQNVLNGTECFTHATTEKTAACEGDTGGPVLVPYNGRMFTVGIVTHAPNCSEIRNPGEKMIVKMMTDVSKYSNWICKWSGICVNGADPFKDKRPTAYWSHTGTNTVR